MKIKIVILICLLITLCIAMLYEYDRNILLSEIETLKAEKMQLYREHEKIQNIRYSEKIKYEENLKAFDKN